MSKAYFLLMVDDFDPTNDVSVKAEDFESLTNSHCEDYIFFDDEDQITPYIAY